MTKWVEQLICIKFFIKLEYSSVVIQKAAAIGNLWLAASSRQRAHSCFTACAEFFCEISSHPGDLALLQLRFGAMTLLAFPKTHLWKGRDCRLSVRFRKIQQGSWWQFQQTILQSVLNSGKDARRTVWGPKVPTLKGTEGSLSCVQGFLYFVSSSNKCLYFQSTWLDTLWTDPIYRGNFFTF